MYGLFCLITKCIGQVLLVFAKKCVGLLSRCFDQLRIFLFVVLCAAAVACTAVEVDSPAVLTVEPEGVVVSPAEPITHTDHQMTETVAVDAITLFVTEETPSVTVNAQGMLPDDCSRISHSRQFWHNGDIHLMIYATRNIAPTCTAVAQAWDEPFKLDVHGLSADTYTVVVNNDVMSEFTLHAD